MANQTCNSCGVTISADQIPANCPACGSATATVTAQAAAPAAETAPGAPQAAPQGSIPSPGASVAPAAPVAPPLASPEAAPASGTDWKKVGELVLEILTIAGGVLPTVLTGGAAEDAKLAASLLRIGEAAIQAHRQVATEPVDYSKLGQEATI